MRGRIPCLHVSDGSNMYPVQAGEGGARIGSLEVVCEGVQVNTHLCSSALRIFAPVIFTNLPSFTSPLISKARLLKPPVPSP